MSWFRKKVEIEVVGPDGKPKRVKIPERQFNQWAAEGKIHPVECQAHILDPTRPERLETWVIGKDVSPEAWGRFKDENGHLYVLVHYADGQPSRHVITKDIWEKTKRDVFSAPTPSSFEEHFDYQHKMLLSSGFEAQAVAAAGINTLWHAFNLEYPNLESFRDTDEATKAEYLRKMSDMIKKMASDELANKAPEGTSRGAFLVHLYLTAVARNDVTMINRFADALEPFNKMAALNLAFREGRVPSDDAWRRVAPFPKVDAPRVRYLTDDEATRLMNACPSALRALVTAALLTGCRFGELADLRPSDVDIAAGVLTIPVSKGGSTRHVVLTDEARQFFGFHIAGKSGSRPFLLRADGAPWGKSHQFRPLREACKSAGINPVVSFHILRHTHASRLAMKGVPMAVIAAQLGHSDVKLTAKHYAHLSPGYVADTIRAAFGSLGLVPATNIAPLRIGS